MLLLTAYIVFSSVCLFIYLSVFLSVNTITPEPLEISSRHFQGIILWSKRRTGLKMAIRSCAGGDFWCSNINLQIAQVMQSRAGGRIARTRRPGGFTYVRGLVLCMKKFFYFFIGFKIFVKIFVHNEIYPWRCYLFNIWISHSSMFYLHVGLYVFMVHTVYEKLKMHSYFLLNIRPTGLTVVLGGGRQIQLWGHREGAL